MSLSISARTFLRIRCNKDSRCAYLRRYFGDTDRLQDTARNFMDQIDTQPERGDLELVPQAKAADPYKNHERSSFQETDYVMSLSSPTLEGLNPLHSVRPTQSYNHFERESLLSDSASASHPALPASAEDSLAPVTAVCNDSRLGYIVASKRDQAVRWSAK